jgi:Cd2+/Zn2+-exporting ATPase
VLLFFTNLEFIAITSFVLGIIIGGYPIAKKGVMEARNITPGMNALMTMAIIGAMAIGEWMEAGAVVFLFALAQFLESKSMDRARRSINSLVDKSPKKAHVIKDGIVEELAVKGVVIGDTIAIKPGEYIPMDGIVCKGNSHVDQSTITGESFPVKKSEDDRVYAGTLNKNGYLEVRVDRTSDQSTFSKIIHLVMEAQAKKAPKQAFIDNFARYYTPIVIILAFGIAVIPPLLLNQPFEMWFYRALVILVIACPCALVISTPVTIVSGLTAAIRKGVLIKGGMFLENFDKVDAIAFDKTGTLTEGRP